MNDNPGFRKRIMRKAAICAVFCFASVFCFGESSDARKIMEDVYRQDTSRSTFMRASFEVSGQRGQRARKEFTYRRTGSPGNSKTIVLFTAPEEIRGVALLSINRRGASDRQFVYTPATQRVRAVAPQERSARFIGTDFTFEDVAERVLDDFTYRLIGEAETIEGHKTWKIEATPADSSRSQYKYIYYWVAQDLPVILHAEMYDAQGKEVRVLHASQIKRVSGISGARRMEMTSVLTGTKTVLVIDDAKFNVAMDDKLFTPEALSQVQDAGPASHSH
ncbi:MAG: outer membrane lipoprotein-sorting protein [Terracidiphilus sp.]|jgi:hypothetical protein